MVAEEIGNIILQNVPLHVALILFAAYVIWSKFLNDKELKPKNIDDLIEIFVLFLFLIVLFNSIYMISSILVYMNNLNYFFNSEKYVSSMYLLLFYFALFLVIFKKGKYDENDLNDVLEFISAVYFAVACFFAGSLLISWITGSVYGWRFEKIFNLLFAVPLVYVLYYLGVHVKEDTWDRNSIFKKWINQLKEKRKPALFILRFSIVLLIMGLLVTYYLVPVVEFEDSAIEYELRQGPRSIGIEDNAYEKVDRNFHVSRKGFLLDVISLDYTGLDFEDEPHFEINYSYDWGDSRFTDRRFYVGKDTKNYQDFGVNDFEIINDSNMIVLNIDRKKMENANVSGFVISGKREKYIKDKFSTSGPEQVGCPKGNCTIHVEFSNRLDLPVLGEGIMLLEETPYRGSCQLMNASGVEIYGDKKYPIVFERSTDNYRFETFRQEAFRLYVRPNNIKYLKAETFYLSEKSQVNLNLTIYDCK